jgi:RNA polymerase sigma factor (sigma-70 family)
MSIPTKITMLEKLGHPANEKERQETWRRFIALYDTILKCWARRFAVTSMDADDLVQQLYVSPPARMAQFKYEPPGRFCDWLRRVAVNKWIDLARKKRFVASPLLDAPVVDENGPDPADDLSDQDYHDYFVQRGLQIVKPDFEPQNWQAAELFIVKRQSFTEIAATQGRTRKAVAAAIKRVVDRIQEEIEGLE